MFLDTNALRLSSRVRPCLDRKLQYLIMLIRSMRSTSGVVCPNLLVFVLVSSGWVASRRTESRRTVVPTARATSLNTVTNVCVRGAVLAMFIAISTINCGMYSVR